MGDSRSDSSQHGDESTRLSQASTPTRTCIGCRGKGGRRLLLRIVVLPSQSRLALDTTRSMPGRGAWLHPDAKCLNLALTRRAFGRALRLDRSVSTDQLVADVEEAISSLSSSDDEVQAPHHAASNDHDRKRV